MALTNELVSQFAKITKQNAQTKSESIVYGTVVEYGESKYVQLDGSNVLTPYTSTTNVAAGERVTVMIKNHTATVTGNKTSPAVRNSELIEIGDKISDFEIVIADKVDTLQLVAVEGRISELEADNVVINETLIANKASINDLETKKLSATDAEIQYANIDFTNIGKAAMEYFYAKSGLIENVTVGDQTITGNLVGVTINGDRIEGNTIIAEKLVIKGDDGLYYKLNTDGMSVEAEQTEYNSLNGTIIQAKSITATKIDVKDLVAFDATIGGFEINDNAIHSITKTTVDNTTRGIYMDNDGQFVVGDASNYMKYYKTSDGSYKLEISLIDTLQSNVDDIQTRLDAVPGQITAAVGGIQIGGTNLIRETGWYTEVAPTSAGWHKTGSGWYERPLDADVNRDDYPENGYSYWNGTAVNDLWTPYVNVQVGETYTVSFRHRGAGLRVIWFGLDANSEQIWGAENTFGHGVTTDAYVTKTIPANVVRFRVVFRTTSGQSGVLGRVKMERGNKPTAWSPNPMDYSRGVVNGSALNITQDAVTINTPVFGVNVSGTNGDMSISEEGMSISTINSPSVYRRYNGPTTLTVGGTVDGVNVFATFSDAFAKLSGCYIPSNVTINISSSIAALYEGTVTLENTSGAGIIVNANGVSLTAVMRFAACKNIVRINNLTVLHGGASNVVGVACCSAVYFTDCKIVGSYPTLSSGLSGFFVQTSRVYIAGGGVHNCYHAIWIDEMSHAHIENCTGSSNQFSVVARRSSYVGLLTQRPQGGISKTADCYVSTDPGGGTATAPSTPTATTTVTLAATNSRTHAAGSWYSGTNVISQGKTSDGTIYRGCIWFNTSAIEGKTIQSARLRIYRKAGVGRGSAVNVRMATCANTVPAAGYDVVVKTDYTGTVIGSVNQKEWLDATIPTAAVQELANETAAGIFLYNNSEAAYSQFDGYGDANPPQLIVTYS